MGQRIEVVFKRSASEDIAKIAWYISGKGYSDNAFQVFSQGRSLCFLRLL